jgi:hypothetical protein
MQDCVGSCGGVWRSLHLAGILCQAVGFVLVHLAGMIFKDNAAINCITVQHKSVSWPSTLMGHVMLFQFILSKMYSCYVCIVHMLSDVSITVFQTLSVPSCHICVYVSLLQRTEI